MDLVAKPENSGNAAIDSAPTMQNSVVSGMLRYRPPSSEAWVVPVRCSTAPVAMNSSAMYSTQANA